MSRPLDRILAELRTRGKKVSKQGSGWIASCPGPNHENGDANPSLSLGAGNDGTPLVHCFAGCSTRDVLAALSLSEQDLYEPRVDSQRLSAQRSLSGAKHEIIDSVEKFAEARKLVAKKLIEDWKIAIAVHNGMFMLEYPTVAGVNRQKNLSGGKPKYRWVSTAKAGGCWYGLDMKPDGVTEVAIANGEPSVWACHAAGVFAICKLGGESMGLTPELIEQLKATGIQKVRVIYDLDKTGRAAARRDAARLREAGLIATAYELPTDLGIKGDVGDLYKSDPPRFVERLGNLPELIGEDVVLPVEDGVFKPSKLRSEMTTAEERLLDLAEGCLLLRDQHQECYAQFKDGDRVITLPIRGEEFAMRLMNKFFTRYGKPPRSQSMKDAIAQLAGMATEYGRRSEVFLRVGHAGGKMYLDLANERQQVVEIDREGWRVIENPPLIFLRLKGMQPLPVPIHGGNLDELRTVLNLPENWMWLLVRGWLLCALQPKGPYFVLVVTGRQGSGKSFLEKILRRLIDPNATPIRVPPKDEHDLIISAKRSWVMAFDNLSGMNQAMSDVLCQIATGCGISKRRLYTDDAEISYYCQRPIMLDGIDDFVQSADLLSRSLVVDLPPIPDDAATPEGVLYVKFEEMLPRVLGALLSAASAGLRTDLSLVGKDYGRMPDACNWIDRCETGSDWTTVSFAAAYSQNRDEQTRIAIEADPLGEAIIAFCQHHDEWDGQMSELRHALGPYWPDSDKASWQMMNKRIGGRLRRIAPSLDRLGITMSESRQSKKRWVHIRTRRKSGDGGDGDDNVVPFSSRSTPAGDVLAPPACPKCARTMSFIPSLSGYRCNSCDPDFKSKP